jgi:hypothetical protein
MVRKSMKELTASRSYTTFDDIFALALAKTKSSRFVADSNKWQKVLYNVCQEYKDRIPELRTMFFDESHPPLVPQSDEFYQLLSILSASKLISLPNPTFEHICMDKSQKRRATNLEEKLLKHYEEYIENIGQMLEKELAVKA